MKQIFLLLILLCSIRLSEQRRKDDSFEDQISRLRGAIIGAFKVSRELYVTTSGRKSNILLFYTKAMKNAKGNPIQWLRYDMPHGNTNFPHININKIVSGITDPHTPISGAAMKVVSGMAKPIEKMMQAAPFAAMGLLFYDIYDIAIQEDNEKRIELLSKKAVEAGGSCIGASQGAAIGTMIFPGVGTIVGSVVGGAFGPEILNSTAQYLWKSFV